MFGFQVFGIQMVTVFFCCCWYLRLSQSRNDPVVGDLTFLLSWHYSCFRSWRSRVIFCSCSAKKDLGWANSIILGTWLVTQKTRFLSRTPETIVSRFLLNNLTPNFWRIGVPTRELSLEVNFKSLCSRLSRSSILKTQNRVQLEYEYSRVHLKIGQRWSTNCKSRFLKFPLEFYSTPINCWIPCYFE